MIIEGADDSPDQATLHFSPFAEPIDKGSFDSSRDWK